jgi:hypothetical protein
VIQFAFKTCAETLEFCELIVNEMSRHFGITPEEAIGRVNRQWRGQNLTNPQDIIFHEDEDFWARDIYFEHNSEWWKDEATAKPKPFP